MDFWTQQQKYYYWSLFLLIAPSKGQCIPLLKQHKLLKLTVMKNLGSQTDSEGELRHKSNWWGLILHEDGIWARNSLQTFEYSITQAFLNWRILPVGSYYPLQFEVILVEKYLRIKWVSVELKDHQKRSSVKWATKIFNHNKRKKKKCSVPVELS